MNMPLGPILLSAPLAVFSAGFGTVTWGWPTAAVQASTLSVCVSLSFPLCCLQGFPGPCVFYYEIEVVLKIGVWIFK